MADLGELVARLRIDTSGLNTGVSQATGQLGQLGVVASKAGDDAENAGRRVSASGTHYVTLGSVVSRALGEMGTWFARLEAASNPLISGLGRLGGVVTTMATNMGTPAAAAAATLVAALAALTIVVIKGVRDFADLGSSVREFQRFTGTGAEEASKLVFALDRLGVGSDAGAQAMGRLNLQVARQPERFAALGIAVSDSNGQLLSSTEILYNVADAYVATESPSQKALIASTAFGTSWRTMVPLLAQGSAGIRKLGDDAERFGLVLSEADVKASREFSASLKELEAAGRGFGIVMARDLVPALTDFVQGATTAVAGATFLAEKVGGVGFVFEVAAGAVSPLASGLLALGKDQQNAADAASELSAQMLLEAQAVGLTEKEIEGLNNATAPAIIQQKALANAVGLMKTELDLATQSYDRHIAGTIGLRNAELGVAEAFAALQDSFAGGAEASLNLRDAQLSLSEALENQRAVYADSTSTALDKERADLAVAQAQATLRAAMDATSTSMDLSTEAGRRNRGAFADAAQAILDHMQALIDSGAPAETIRAAWDADTAALNAQMHQAGFTTEQIASLNREYGLVPETVNTAINIAMDTQKIALLQIVSQNMGQLDGATAQVILDQIGAGDTAAAIDTVTEALRDLADYQAALGAGFTFPPGSIIHVPKPIDEVPGQPHALGGLVTKPELALIGEAGPELILPLTKPSRMASLLNQYGGAVPMAEGGLMGGTPVTSSTNNWMQGATIVVQASDPAELERKLEQRARLSRMSGAL